MINLKRKLIVLCGSATLLLAGFDFTLGQTRTINPGIYNRTRRTMSNRAAVKKSVRKIVKKRSVSVKKKRRLSQQ